jgi:hypothetical protein
MNLPPSKTAVGSFLNPAPQPNVCIPLGFSAFGRTGGVAGFVDSQLTWRRRLSYKDHASWPPGNLQ